MDFSSVISYLLEHKITLASAESCTGGYFAKTVTDFPGVSSIFDRGLVTYSEKAKEDELGVSRKTLERYTAVSQQTAAEMALGLYRKTGCHVCVSVTGYAGPVSPLYPDEPVGLFFVGLCYKEQVSVRRFQCSEKDRDSIRRRALEEMFRMISEIVMDGNVDKYAK